MPSLDVFSCYAAEPLARKVLLIGIDGVRPDALEAAYTPHLDRLVRYGAFARDTQILGEGYRLSDTVSAVGWSSILTGVWADKHGVHDRDFKGANFGKYPDFLRRLKQVRPAAQTAAFISWPAIAQHIITSADVVRVFDATHQSLAGYLEADRQVAVAARRHLAERDPDALFVYFVSPDIAGHHNGFDPGVSEYRRAIEVVDGLTGMILRAIEARRTFSEEAWLVLVTSDHGGKGTHHRKGHQDKDVLTVFLIVSGSAAWPGEIKSPTYIVDAPVTALTHLGVEIDNAWGLDGKPVGLRGK